MNMSRTTNENIYDINLSLIRVKSTKWFSLNLDRHTTDATQVFKLHVKCLALKIVTTYQKNSNILSPGLHPQVFHTLN